MKGFCVTLVFSLLFAAGRAQTTDTYLADLEKLHSELQGTPSYKDQIKGETETAYMQLYKKLQSAQPHTRFEHFYLLAQLVISIKDNHLGFYETPDTTVSYQKFSDTAFVKSYRSTNKFKHYPAVSLNVDSLENALKDKPLSSVEGIFWLNNYMRAGIYRTAKPDSLVGVLLECSAPVWDRGQVVMILKEYEPNKFNVYFADVVRKGFMLQRNVNYRNGKLTLFSWQKRGDFTDYINLPDTVPVFQLKTLDNNIQYLRLGTFNASNESLVVSNRFYDSIKNKLTGNALIVDIRNNGGGAFKASKKFLKLIDDFAGKNKVAVLVNNRTVSNAEQSTIKLKGRKNIIILGENTRGTLTYGSNYGRTQTLPGGFKVYPTDMNDDGGYLPYEDTGVAPDKYLRADSDWIEQAITILTTE